MNPQLRNLVRRLMIALLASLAVANAAPARTPASAPRIVAIGDLHGDHDVWLAIAAAAGVMNGAGHWSGGRTILVQAGDIVDREPDSLAIIRDLMRLEREAARAGGKVVVLVGNHEAMMVTGDFRYVHPQEYAHFADKKSAKRRDQFYADHRTALEAIARATDPAVTPEAVRARWLAQTPLGKIEHAQAWSPSGELGRWIIAKPAVVRIGDSLFVHGGISPSFATLPIDQINQRVATALAARDEAPTSIINDPLGPLWYRGLAGLAESGAAALPPIAQQLDTLLAAMAARRIVIAHTPSLSGVATSFDGRLVRIDSGNSRAYGGVPGYVEIVGGRVVTHNVARPAATTNEHSR